MAKQKSSKKSKKKSRPVWEVAPSNIHGTGLFAARKITKHKVIGHYKGPIVLSEEDDGDHVLWIEEVCGKVYGVDGQNEMRFVNHSKKPNAYFDGEDLVALAPIKKGDEITHNYGADWLDIE